MIPSTYVHGRNPDKASFDVVKRVNDGPWMRYTGSHPSRETAEEAIRRGKAIHAERCPNDRVEWAIQRIY